MGKRKKSSGGQQQENSKVASGVRVSLPRTRARKESRQERYRKRVARKTQKLERRIKILEGLGISYLDRPDMPLGIRHKRMRRLARLKGVIGLPLRQEILKEEPEEKTEIRNE